MQRKEMIEVMVTYCDVCNRKCYGHTTHVGSEGRHYHTCFRFNDNTGRTCAEELQMRMSGNENYETDINTENNNPAYPPGATRKEN